MPAAIAAAATLVSAAVTGAHLPVIGYANYLFVWGSAQQLAAVIMLVMRAERPLLKLPAAIGTVLPAAPATRRDGNSPRSCRPTSLPMGTHDPSVRPGRGVS